MNNNLSSFHDACLVGANLLSQLNAVQIEISDGDSEILLMFKGVKAFRLTDMQTQNVIYRVKKHSGRSVNDEEIKASLRWVSSSIDSKPYMTDEIISRYARNIRSGALNLVVLESSVGAELVVLCESIEQQEMVSGSLADRP